MSDEISYAAFAWRSSVGGKQAKSKGVFAVPNMDLKLQQRASIRFCVLLDKTPSQTLEMLQQAYKEQAMGKTQVFEWHKRFREGKNDLEDAPRPGRPSTSKTETNVNTIDAMLREDRRLSITKIAEIMKISYGSAEDIVRNVLGYRKVAAKWVPRVISDEQKAHRVMACQQWKGRLQREPDFLDKVITCDESWFHHYDPETKQESAQWKHPSSPRPKKAKVQASAGKVMHLVFFDKQGIVYDHVVDKQRTVTANYYCEVLQGPLRRKIATKRPNLAQMGWILHQDNAPAHRAIKTQETITELGIEVMPHPPYSPDLAPCDFHLFPAVKKELRGRYFQSDRELNNTISGILNRLSKRGFRECFEQWTERWNRCIVSEGDYFEGL